MDTTQFFGNAATMLRGSGRMKNVRVALNRAGLYPARVKTGVLHAAWLLIASCAPTSELKPLSLWIEAMQRFFALCKEQGIPSTLDVLCDLLDPEQDSSRVDAALLDRVTLSVMVHRNGKLEMMTSVSPVPIPAVPDCLFFTRETLDDLRDAIAGTPAAKAKFYHNKNLN